MVTYESNRTLSQKHSVKFEKTKRLDQAENAGFPNCKGLYPDCPEVPNKKDRMCRTCPILDEMAESSKP